MVSGITYSYWQWCWVLKGASHQVGQGEGFIKGVKNIGEETLAGGGFVNMPQRAINREGNLGYQFSKKLAKAEESDNEVVSGAAKGLRDLTSKWLDDRAPILRDFVGKIKEPVVTQTMQLKRLMLFSVQRMLTLVY